MKNEAAFIPDNISAISNVSRHQILPNPSHQFTQLHSDSTDNLVEEILRQRAERLKKEQSPTDHVASVEKIQNSHSVKEQTQFQNQNENKSQSKLGPIETKQLNFSKEEFQQAQKLMNHSKGTINQSSMKEKEQNNKLEVQDHIEVLNNQTNQFSLNQIEENGDKDHVDNTDNKFSLPKIDKMSNGSVNEKQEVSQAEQKSLQLNLSLSPSEKRQQGIQNQESSQKSAFVQQQKIIQDYNKENSVQLDNSLPKEETIKEKSIHSEQKSKIKMQASSNNSNHMMHQEIGNGQSQIEVKNSELQLDHVNNSQQKKGFFDFTPIPQKNQTDLQLVKAITQHLNTIQNEQFSQKTFRISEKQVVPPKQKSEVEPIIEDINKEAPFEEFETNYSQNNRQVKILEHRWESNLQYQIDQLKEMIDLYEASILNEQCKQARRQIKELQLNNRREKIALRAASYTKRFNFHSPIDKNNRQPIQFRTKFVISPRLSGQYHQTKQNIADQKKKHVDLEDEYNVLCDYYDMMKQKKITVYQETLKQFEYNSKLQKYETVKNGFFKKTSMNSLKQTPIKSQYQFNKTKRTIQIQNANVPFYQVLKYKIDISKDMILQFEVWNLSKIKKLKDQNLLIKKEIKHVEQLIHQIDAQFIKIFGLKTVKSLSKSRFSSPNTIKLANTSPMKSLTKSPIRQLQLRKTELTSSPKISLDISSSSNGFKSNATPKKKLEFKRQKQSDNNQLLLINSVQLDYSKRKAMRILDQIDDYGMCPIIEQSKVIEDVPTFGKQQKRRLITSPAKQASRSKSKNFVRPRSREIKTMTNLDRTERSNKKIGKMSEQNSPRKPKPMQKSQYYTSVDELMLKDK